MTHLNIWKFGQEFKVKTEEPVIFVSNFTTTGREKGLFSSNSCLICLSDRSQCLESHGIVDFAYKLQLYYNIYTLIFPIWMENIIKVKTPLGSCKLYGKRNIP